MPKLDDRWNLGLWLGRSLASDEHHVGTSAGVRRCRSIWRRPEKQRWDRKMLTEMNGEPWNPTGHHQDKPPQVRGVYITVERQIKHGGTKGCAACFGNAKVHSPECRVRFQDTVDSDAAQTAAASASEPNVEMQKQAAGGSAPSSCGGPVPAAGRTAPEDANMEAAESSTGQPTSSVVRTLDAEDDTSALCSFFYLCFLFFLLSLLFSSFFSSSSFIFFFQMIIFCFSCFFLVFVCHGTKPD